MNSWLGQPWLIIAGILVILVTIICTRYLDRKWIEARFGKNRARAMSFGVSAYIKTKGNKKPTASSGFLLLLPERLFYRSRLARMEIDIPAANMVRVYHGTSLKGQELHHSVVKIDFVDEHNNKNTVAFKVPYPPQWINAIENTLIAHPPA